jgi:hypothetical protein
MMPAIHRVSKAPRNTHCGGGYASQPARWLRAASCLANSNTGTSLHQPRKPIMTAQAKWAHKNSPALARVLQKCSGSKPAHLRHMEAGERHRHASPAAEPDLKGNQGKVVARFSQASTPFAMLQRSLRSQHLCSYLSAHAQQRSAQQRAPRPGLAPRPSTRPLGPEHPQCPPGSHTLPPA